MDKYIRFYPGKYYDWEKAEVERILREAEEMNLAVPELDMSQAWLVSEEELLAYNRIYNPYDPLYSDPDYARSVGFPGVPAYPGIGERRIRRAAIAPLPKDIADEFYFTNDGSTIEYYGRIFPGDWIIPCEKHMEIVEDTSEGDITRRWRFVGTTTFRDKEGRLKARCTGTTRDAYRKYADGSPRMDISENLSKWTKDFPPAHVTTDADYKRMKTIWDLEDVQDDRAPFWEDVKIGTKLPRTCSDGPITHMHLNYYHNIGGLSIWTRQELMSEEIRRTVYRDRYGQFLDETAVHYNGRNIPGSRAVFYNYTAADLIARVVTNYIGTRGYVSYFSWRLYPFFEEMRTGPVGADLMSKINYTPEMQGKNEVNRHGAEGDTVIGHAIVTDKYVDARGNHIVAFVVWGETLDGDTLQVCDIRAVMESRIDNGLL